jgi:hypothetical protein
MPDLKALDEAAQKKAQQGANWLLKAIRHPLAKASAVTEALKTPANHTYPPVKPPVMVDDRIKKKPF